MNQKELDTYFRQIKLLLPLYTKKEKQFLRDFKDSVNEFCSQSPNCTMEDVIARFSTPKEIVHDYIVEALQTEDLCKKISLSRSIKRAIAVLLLLAALSTAFWGISCYKAYLDSKESVISQELIVIE